MAGSCYASGNYPLFTNVCGRVYVCRDLSGNSLRSIIPQEFGALKQLERLDLSYNNNLCGPFPLELLSKLVHLDLSNSNLAVKLRLKLDRPDLVYLDLSNSNLQGTFPLQLHLPELEHLDISNNNLSGELPLDLDLPKLVYLNISNNNLQGELPIKLNLPELEHLDFCNNNFCGGLTENIENLFDPDQHNCFNSFDNDCPETTATPVVTATLPAAFTIKNTPEYQNCMGQQKTTPCTEL